MGVSSSSPLLSTEAHARVGCLPVSVCILHSFCRSRIARGLLSFICLGYVWAALRVVWVGAPLVVVCSGGSLSPVAGPWSAHCARLGNAPPCGVWLPGVVALVAYAVSGCPCGCAWLVRLRGFPCFSCAVLFAWAACVLVCTRLALRMSGAAVGVPLCGVFSACVVVRLCGAVCRLCLAMSRIACLLRFGLFDCYCVMCVS